MFYSCYYNYSITDRKTTHPKRRTYDIIHSGVSLYHAVLALFTRMTDSAANA